LYLFLVTGKQVLDLLKAHGWSLDRIAGSHHIMVKEGYPIISVPVHGSKDLKPGTLHAILKAGGIK
jgi:predicted RNA binding protein YcfA (HicA-like mRNA interferase family)